MPNIMYILLILMMILSVITFDDNKLSPILFVIAFVTLVSLLIINLKKKVRSGFWKKLFPDMRSFWNFFLLFFVGPLIVFYKPFNEYMSGPKGLYILFIFCGFFLVKAIEKCEKQIEDLKLEINYLKDEISDIKNEDH